MKYIILVFMLSMGLALFVVFIRNLKRIRDGRELTFPGPFRAIRYKPRYPRASNYSNLALSIYAIFLAIEFARRNIFGFEIQPVEELLMGVGWMPIALYSLIETIYSKLR